MDIKKIRTKALLTQAELAKKLNVSTYTIQRWEGGLCEISIRNKRKIIEFCKENTIDYEN